MSTHQTLAIRARHPKTSLTALPLDAILCIVSYLSTARDISALVRTTKATYLVTGHGQQAWRVFVHRFLGFIDVPLPDDAPPDYTGLANRLTWMVRCWERRSFRLTLWRPTEEGEEEGNDSLPTSSSTTTTTTTGRRGGPSNRRPKRDRTAENVQILIDAKLLNRSGKGEGGMRELVVWGVGEDLCARVIGDDWRSGSHWPEGAKKASPHWEEQKWARRRGVGDGYSPKIDDVTAVCVVERGDEVAALVGRGRGQLEMVHALPGGEEGNGFGTPVRTYQRFPTGEESGSSTPLSLASSSSLPMQGAVSRDLWSKSLRFARWDGRSDFIATGDGSSTLRLYSVDDPSPRIVQDLSQSLPTPPGERPQLVTARFLSADTLVCGFSMAHSHPLRVVTIRPSGVSIDVVAAATNEDLLTRAGIDTAPEGKLSVRDVQPLVPTSAIPGGENVVLSAWADGTCRLIDVRTPSIHDVVYRDEFGFYADFTALLLYGARGFVAAESTGMVYLFDSRMSKPYAHTDAMRCSAYHPETPQHSEPPRNKHNKGVMKCNPLSGLECRWHTLSRLDGFRPNAIVYPARREQVNYTLASASHLSPSFYVGCRGSFNEYDLGAEYRWSTNPLVAGQARAAGWRRDEVRVSLAETAVGLAKASVRPSTWMPRVVTQHLLGVDHSRLDPEYGGYKVPSPDGYVDPARLATWRARQPRAT